MGAMQRRNQDKGQLERAPLYQSLQRKPYLLGLPQEAFFLVALILVCLAIAARLDPKVLAGCALFYLVLLPMLRALFEKEPYLMEIIPRAVHYRARYPRQAKEQARLWGDRVEASVPMGRSPGA